MRSLVLNLIVIFLTAVTTPPAMADGKFSSTTSSTEGIALRGPIEQPELKKEETTKQQRFKKKLQDKISRISRFPQYIEYPDDRLEHRTYSRRLQKDEKDYSKDVPIDLNPAIFSPTQKLPLTLIIKNGKVVESYRGY